GSEAAVDAARHLIRTERPAPDAELVELHPHEQVGTVVSNQQLAVGGPRRGNSFALDIQCAVDVNADAVTGPDHGDAAPGQCRDRVRGLDDDRLSRCRRDGQLQSRTRVGPRALLYKTEDLARTVQVRSALLVYA